MRHKYMTLSTGDRCAKLWHSNDIYHKRNQWVALSMYTFMVSITWIATAARLSLQNVTLIETGLWAQLIYSRKDNSIEFNSIEIFSFQFTLIETGFWAQLICSRKDRTALTATFLALCHFLSSVQLMHYYAFIHSIDATFSTANSNFLATSALWHFAISIPDIQLLICWGKVDWKLRKEGFLYERNWICVGFIWP